MSKHTSTIAAIAAVGAKRSKAFEQGVRAVMNGADPVATAAKVASDGQVIAAARKAAKATEATTGKAPAKATIKAEVEAHGAAIAGKLAEAKPAKGKRKAEKELAAIKGKVAKPATVRAPSPISTMRAILAKAPGLTMKASDLKVALAAAGFPNTPQSTVNATLAGWVGDLRALQAAGALSVPFATVKAS